MFDGECTILKLTCSIFISQILLFQPRPNLVSQRPSTPSRRSTRSPPTADRDDNRGDGCCDIHNDSDERAEHRKDDDPPDGVRLAPVPGLCWPPPERAPCAPRVCRRDTVCDGRDVRAVPAPQDVGLHAVQATSSQAAHIACVALQGTQTRSATRYPATHSVHPTSLLTSTAHPTTPAFGLQTSSTLMWWFVPHRRNASPFTHVAHSSRHAMQSRSFR